MNVVGTENVFVGYQADASAPNLTNAVAIGANAVVGADNSMCLGDSSMKVGIRTGTPALALDVAAAMGTRHLDLILGDGLNSDVALSDTSFVRITGPPESFLHRGADRRSGRAPSDHP